LESKIDELLMIIIFITNLIRSHCTSILLAEVRTYMRRKLLRISGGHV